MKLKDILAISGYSGLYKLVKHSRNGVIVESVVTGKKMQAFATSKISALEDIAIYTEDGDIPLSEVFDRIYEKENGGAAISHKSKPEELKKYLEEVLPEYDKERVYVSDIKRLLNWYNILQENNLLIKEDDNEKQQENTDESKATNSDK